MKRYIYILILFLYGTTNAISQISTFPYKEDWENGTGGWIGSSGSAGLFNPCYSGPSTWELGNASAKWGLSAHSGTNTWSTNLSGPYSNNTMYYLTSPEFDLSATQNPILEFWMVYQIEYGWDEAVVEYSVNNGGWTKLGNYNSSNWYSTYYTGQGLTTGYDWTGTYYAWKKYTTDISNLKYSNVRFRIVLKADWCVQYNGLMIDDFGIYENASISTSALSLNNYCQGAALSVPYIANGTYNPGNIFTAQLSDASGSFSLPINIGTTSTTASGTVNVTIPANATAANGYRIRVVSSDPAVTGTDNGSNITIKAVPAAPSLPTQTFCSSDNATVASLPQDNGSYTWYQNQTGGSALDPTTALSTSSLYVSESSNGCESPRADVSVAITATPVLVVTNPTAVCAPATVDLTDAAIITGSTLPPGTTLEYYTAGGTLTAVADPQHVSAGTYIIKAVNGTCSDSKQVTVTVNPQPQVYTVGGGGTYCSDGSGVNITLSNSESGIDYNLLLSGNTTPVATQPGTTGAALMFSNITATGGYTIQAVNATTSCSIPMTGSATVAVNPVPTVDAISNATYCNQEAGAAIPFSGTVSGTTFTWESSADVGFGTSGNGNIGAYTATNTTGAPITATITVTPHYNGGGVTCDGTPTNFTVTINPTPTAVAGVASQTICSGTAISNITLSGAVSGTTYNWTRDNTTSVTGIGSSGSGDISGTLSTTSTSAQITKFTITPLANGCAGTAIVASVTVNPLTYISTSPAASTKYVAENTFFSVSATGTGTLGYKWQVNTGSGWSDIANVGVYTNATTSTLTLTNVTYAMNGYQYRSVVSGDCGTATSTAATLTVNKRPVILAYTGGTSIQYSDQVSLSATFSDNSGSSINTDLSGRKITFTIGSQTATAYTNSSGVASTTLIVTQAPGNYTVGVSFDGTSDLVYQSSTLTPAPSFTINKEDARAYYTGSLFASTSGATASTATLTLSATIKDITAVSGDPVYDAFAGDIRKAKVMFVNRDASNAPISGWLTPGLVSSTDLKTGTVTFNWGVNIGNANSQSYNIGTVVDAPGYYAQNSSTDDQVVTVSKPLPDFITGGGYLLLQKSAGLKAGDVGSRNNFGFNVKYNKSGTNLQGNINAIVRRTESDGKQHVYQIKGNSMTSLAVNAAKTTAHPYPTAVFDGKASITDITNPVVPTPVDGGARLHVTMTDRGEPGNTDGIAITVWNKDGGLWFSSNWNTTTTVEQVLAGGNLKVSTNSSFSSGTTTTTTTLTQAVVSEQDHFQTKLTVTVLPNPSHSYFTLHTQSSSDKPLVIRIIDALGRVVEMKANVNANGTLMLGGNYRPGTYFTEVMQGSERTTLKLIKQGD